MIKFKISGIDLVTDQITKFDKAVRDEVSAEINAFAVDIQRDAKTLAPKDQGLLSNQIQVKKNGKYNVEVVVNSKYAAYMEFGTKGFAAKYVASLPPDWQELASKFKGEANGDFGDLLLAIVKWVRRKGLSGTYKAVTYDVRTRQANRIRRTGSRKNWDQEDIDVAYPIAFAISKKGVKQNPFLYPAYQKNLPKFLQNLDKLLS
jgi:HK97 gp10 family phage protein